MKETDIDYMDGEQRCLGWLVYDESVTAARPGILVVHEAWGLDPHTMERTRMLAKMGYVALAADMYGDRKQANDVESMMAYSSSLRSNPEKLRQRAGAALDTLMRLPQVDPSRLAGIGFCFGGSTSLELARDGRDIKGVVSFHGGLATSAPAVPGTVKAKILVCTGADDPYIPLEQIAAFQKEMSQAGADWQVISYSDTLHSFTNPAAANHPEPPGLIYQPRSDERAWFAMQTFFNEIFRTGESGYQPPDIK